jgi:RNA polymerase sigma factor (sigma-70 family)
VACRCSSPSAYAGSWKPRTSNSDAGAGTGGRRVEDLLRELAPQVLGVLARRFGDFDAAEDAVQEALLSAAVHWSRQGTPDNPRGWLIQTGSRKLLDQLRSEQARRHREVLAALREPPGGVESTEAHDRDDTLIMLFMCCHPSLTSASAIALTLRAIGGLTTAEIAKAFLVPEATMAQRISRAKQRIKASGVPLQMPASAEWPQRLRSVLHVLYLIFNEAAMVWESAGSACRRIRSRVSGSWRAVTAGEAAEDRRPW